MPCQRVNTTGRKSFGSWLNRIVAPLETCRSTLLSRWMAPVRKLPGGTITCPPPARLQAAMAAAKAAVFIVVPSPTAPKWVTSKFRGGNHGRRTEATIRSAARSQGGLGGLEAPPRPGGVWGGSSPRGNIAPVARAGTARPSAPRRSRLRRSISCDMLPPRGDGGYWMSQGCLLGVGLRVASALGEEVEVAALVGLGDVLAVEGAVATLELRRLGGPWR